MLPQAPITVCLTGAAGQISYALLPQLLNGSIFGKSQPINLHLLEIPPALPALAGVVMELEDCVYPLLNSVLQTDDASLAFKGANVAILIGAFPRKKGMERTDLLERNARIFQTQGAAINQVADPNIKILVVGNPANTNALILRYFAPNIPDTNITALTRLDHNRTVAQIAKQLSVSVSDVSGVCIWGNHSATQYPDVTRAQVAGSPVLPQLGGEEFLAEKLIPTIQKRGASVIAARGLSSALSAATAIADHLRSWLMGDDQVVSMAVISDGSYAIEKGLYFSFPVRCTGNANYQIVQDIEISDFSMRYLQATSAELCSEREEALKLLS